MSGRIWFSTAQAAEHANNHPDTIRKACEDGSLHGTQRKAKGRWRINVNCLDAWCAGEDCQHQAAGAA